MYIIFTILLVATIFYVWFIFCMERECRKLHARGLRSDMGIRGYMLRMDQPSKLGKSRRTGTDG